MKRALCILLTVVMIIAMFSGCAEAGEAGELEPLRILVDADAPEFAEESCKKMMEEFIEYAVSVGGPTDVVIEVLPSLDNARESALDRIRTEIMAGDGPDLFIVRSDRGVNDRDLLFPIPEKAMENGLFLPLDKYIKKAQFMEWDKHTKAIMDAGRDRFGQQMIPMVYTTPLTFYRTADIPDVKPEADTSWQDMLEDETNILRTAATWRHSVKGNDEFKESENSYLEYILGDLADFRKDKLLFSEEELLQRVIEVIETENAYKEKEISSGFAHYQTRIYPGFDYDLDHHLGPGLWIDTRYTKPDQYRGIQFKDEQTMIPIYSDDGGVTATIAAFTAINANTRRAEDAFFIMDLLLSRYWQQQLNLYDVYFGGGAAGIPVHEDLMQKGYPIRPIFYIKQANYQEYSRVREQITRAYFRGDFTDSFEELYKECKPAYVSGKDIEPIVAEFYQKLKIMIAE